MGKTTARAELLIPLSATLNELVVMSEAVTRYTNWLARTPASATEHQETIALLNRFQRRLTQPANIQPQKAKRYERH